MHDSQAVEAVLVTPRPALAVTADKAYDSEKVRQMIRDDGALPAIPSKSNARKKAWCPKRILSTSAPYRELLLRHQGLAARGHALRQTREEFPCRREPGRGHLLDQFVSPDPNAHALFRSVFARSWPIHCLSTPSSLRSIHRAVRWQLIATAGPPSGLVSPTHSVEFRTRAQRDRQSDLIQQPLRSGVQAPVAVKALHSCGLAKGRS